MVFVNNRTAYSDRELIVNCGQCSGCRLEKSRQWAIRCHHEAQMNSSNAFITLTYNDQHVPRSGSLNLRHFQLFMKRLRKKFGANIRFYHCGEYGELYARPHYHACLFGIDFADKKPYKKINDNMLYTSQMLESLWTCKSCGKPLGYTTTAAVTFQSAAYVARYLMKKINGPNSEEHYQWVDKYGEIFDRKPEYTTMSRRPGIGTSWLTKFRSDVYPHDHVIINGEAVKPPKFYDNSHEHLYLTDFQAVKRKRIFKGKANALTPRQLNARRVIVEQRTEELKRKLK